MSLYRRDKIGFLAVLTSLLSDIETPVINNACSLDEDHHHEVLVRSSSLLDLLISIYQYY